MPATKCYPESIISKTKNTALCRGPLVMTMVCFPQLEAEHSVPQAACPRTAAHADSSAWHTFPGLCHPPSWTNSSSTFKTQFEKHHLWEACGLSSPNTELGMPLLLPGLARHHTVLWSPNCHSHQTVRPLKAVTGSWLLLSPWYLNKYNQACT